MMIKLRIIFSAADPQYRPKWIVFSLRSEIFTAANNHNFRHMVSQFNTGPAIRLSSSWTETYPYKYYDEVVVHLYVL